ncbi:MAG: oxidoreductase [Actinomycetes bacterium]
MATSTPDPGRVWFVTGASSGLGRALAQRVLAHGADRLVATAREPATLRDIEHAYPGQCRVVTLDVTDAETARVAVDQAVDAFGRLDVVVNNAGYGAFGAVEELTEQALRRQFEVNVFGLLHVTRAALPHLRRQRAGHLVQMSSLNGVVGQTGAGAYAGTKFAVEGISESLAEELAPMGIRVTIVEPGPFRTGFAGASAHVADPIDDYADSVGRAREFLRQLDGSQPGDPDRAAEAVIAAVEAKSPPLRLALGRDAHAAIRDKLTRQLRELDSWERATADTALTPRLT